MKKKQKFGIKHIILGLLFLVGLGVMLYPTVSNMWNDRIQSRAIEQFDESIDKMGKFEQERILKEAKAYNATLVGGTVPDAFLMTDFTPNPKYEKLLNPVGNGYMGSVEVPSIKIKIPIYHYTRPDILQIGAGHLPGSSLPVGGKTSHCVISAHRGLPSARLFTDLDRVKEGNRFFLHVMNETLAYQVDQIKVVEPTNTRDLAIVDGKDYCTLLTCTPYGVNSHRLLVRGHRIPYSEEILEDESVAKAPPSMMSVIRRILCVVAGIVIALIIVFIIDRRNRRKKKKQ